MFPPPGGVPRMHKLRELVGAQGYQRFPLSKHAVGQNIAVHAVPAYRASTYLVSAFLAHSTLFYPLMSRPDMTFAVDWALNNNYLSPLLFNPQRWNVEQ